MTALAPNEIETINKSAPSAAPAQRWSIKAIEALFALPFNDLMFRAQEVHRQHHAANAVQRSTLLSIKTGGCSEDCGYCSQSSRYGEAEREALLPIAEVIAAAQAAKDKGASRFCMGAAWRELEFTMAGMPYPDVATRMEMLDESLTCMRSLWTRERTTFAGRHYQFKDAVLWPKPVQNPCPIWLATNAERLSKGQSDFGGSEFALRRVGRVADGWMTHSVSPEGFQKSWDFILDAGREHGRDMAHFDHVLYHHINVNEDKDAALADSKKFLDLYYGANYSKERLEAWLTYGSPRECIEQLKRFKDCGCRRVTFRISTMGDPMIQLRRTAEEVLPFV